MDKNNIEYAKNYVKLPKQWITSQISSRHKNSNKAKLWHFIKQVVCTDQGGNEKDEYKYSSW